MDKVQLRERGVVVQGVGDHGHPPRLQLVVEEHQAREGRVIAEAGGDLGGSYQYTARYCTYGYTYVV